MGEVNIRPARPADIPTITRIYADAVTRGTATFETEPPDELEMARRQQALLAKTYPYLVAEYAAAIAGYAYAGPYHVRAAYRWSVEDSIYVASDFQRLGIGRQLLVRLIADAETLGFRQMIGVIGDAANAASIALLAACGFRLVGTLQSVGFKHGRWLGAVLMQRPLGKGDLTPP
jgi:L-amino acid N-acyltransferase YncA